MQPRIFSARFLSGCTVTQTAHDVVLKSGTKVRRAEETAMRLVRAHAPSTPIPEVYGSWYGHDEHGNHLGRLSMSFVPGRTLDKVWPSLDDAAKERVCRDTWSMIAKIRTIPRPPALSKHFCCSADGSPICDPLLGGYTDRSPPLPSDEAVRARIFEQYVKCNGLSYADGKDLPKMLPRSSKSVFTHGDITPRNIMVDESGRILAILDWESAGWYPDYWEYARMMRLYDDDVNWMAWMARTSPEAWDITGIKKARRVLF